MRIIDQWTETFNAAQFDEIVRGARHAFNGNTPEGRCPLYIILEVEWNGVTGGDATSDLNVAVQVRNDDVANADYSPLFIKEYGNNAPSTTAPAVTDTGAPANGKKMYLAMNPPSNVASMAFPAPILGYVFFRGSNPGTTYTAGTVTVRCSAVTDV